MSTNIIRVLVHYNIIETLNDKFVIHNSIILLNFKILLSYFCNSCR